ASGAWTASTICAPRTTSPARPSSAPASSYRASGRQAPSPAPRSTATLAPSAINLRTVSGVTATRLSPAARSCRTAIRNSPPATSGYQDDDEEDNRRNQRDRPLEHPDEAPVGLFVGVDVVCGFHRANAPFSP